MGFAIWADDQAHRAMSVNVVRAVLGVVLDDEDCHLIPEFAVAGGFDEAAQRQIVVAYAGFGGRRAGARAAGMILAEGHDGEAWEFPGLLGVVEVPNPMFDAIGISRAHPVATVDRRHAPGAFAVVLEVDSVAFAKVPEVTRGRDFHVGVPGNAAMAGVGHDPRALREIRGDGGIAPAMSIHADLAVA